jgi:hypothetical protein
MKNCAPGHCCSIFFKLELTVRPKIIHLYITKTATVFIKQYLPLLHTRHSDNNFSSSIFKIGLVFEIYLSRAGNYRHDKAPAQHKHRSWVQPLVSGGGGEGGGGDLLNQS